MIDVQVMTHMQMHYRGCWRTNQKTALRPHKGWHATPIMSIIWYTVASHRAPLQRGSEEAALYTSVSAVDVRENAATDHIQRHSSLAARP